MQFVGAKTAIWPNSVLFTKALILPNDFNLFVTVLEMVNNSQPSSWIIRRFSKCLSSYSSKKSLPL